MFVTSVFGDAETTADEDESVTGPSGIVESAVAQPSLPSSRKPTKRTSRTAVSWIPTNNKEKFFWR